MFRTKLITIASLFTLSLVTGCLTDETDIIDPVDPGGDVGELPRDNDRDEPADENGCRIRKDTGELECPESED